MNKLSLKAQITLLVIILLTISTVVLTIVLNLSVNKITTTIGLTQIVPATNQIHAIKLTPASTNVLSPLIEEARSIFKLDSIIYSLGIIFLGGFLTYFMIGKTLKPVKYLNKQIKNIEVNNLNQAIVYNKTNDELGELSESFNKMTMKLDKAVKFQQQFAASAAHELKTPLAILRTKLDIFRKKNIKTESEYESIIQLFDDNTKRMTNIVDSLFKLAYSNEINMKSISLHGILSNIIDDLNEAIINKNIQVTYHNENITLMGSQNLLYQALFNVVENAIKYNVEHGEIKINTYVENDLIHIEIKDTGIGIPEDSRDKIYDAFYRHDSSTSSKISGAGLGLSISKHIIQRHRGTIKCISNEAAGCLILITLPSYQN